MPKRSMTPPPDSRANRPTMPPGADDADALGFELLLAEHGETETRLQYLARVCRVAAIK